MTQAVRLAKAASAPQIDIQPLGPVMGAEVTGLDLSKPLSPEVLAILEELFMEYKVLCFRDQDLTPEQQLAFTQQWGPPLEHTMANHVRGGPNDYVQIASNRNAEGKPNGKHPDPSAMRWHTDRSWRAEPALATILFGAETPAVGGDTLFCNTTMAYEGLPDDVKQRVGSMKVIHSVEYSRRTGDGPPATEYELKIAPPVAHPVGRKHPVTGRPALYLGCHAWKMDGMPEDEGRKMIDELMAFATQDRFVYRHKWRRHDLVMWDNRCTFHAATPYDTSKEIRVMHRTVVQGGPTS